MNKEYFTEIIQEQYAQEPTFLDDIENDMSEFVDNNKIHLSEAGIEPEVYIDATGDIPSEERTDTPNELVLKTASSKNTIVKNLDELLTSYNKAESVTRGHARGIMRKIASNASHTLTAGTDSLYTPVIGTSGSVVGGFKILTEDDLWILAEKFDAADAPSNRILVLHDFHFTQLLKTSDSLKMQQGNSNRLGIVGTELYNFAGFKIRKFKGGAVFNKTTGIKKAYGAAAAPSTDTIASFAFVGSEAMKAFGDSKAYITLDDPTKRADIMGFDRRFLISSLRNKYIGAIYSAA